MGFFYGLRMRPASVGSVPSGFNSLLPSVEHNPNMRHGVVEYNSQLSEMVVRQFELVPLTGEGGQVLQLPLIPSSVLRQVVPAIESFHYIEKELAAGSVVLGDVEEEIKEMLGKLTIFLRYATDKNVDVHQFFDEVGGLPESLCLLSSNQVIFDPPVKSVVERP